MLKFITVTILISVVIALAGINYACSSGGDDDPVYISSRAYKGHENDVDVNNLCRAYNAIVGTKLDDCSTCHTGEMEEGVQVGNACDWCHDLMLHSDGGHTYSETLNVYGAAYMNAGRTIDAIHAIRNLDSDLDGYSNLTEINAIRYPGYAHSQPGQPEAATIIVTMPQIKTITTHEQFILANANKQQFDDYVSYDGVKIMDLFDELGIDMTGATGITVSAPDGFQKSFTLDELNMNFPNPIYDAGLDVGTLGTDCGFVVYAPEIPEGLNDLDTIPGDYFLQIAWMRDGVQMEKSYYDAVSGTIEGEGPFRLVVPQTEPGLPDRGSKYSPTTCDDGYDYDENADHNAGSMVRGVVAIRIDPMPIGVEEYDFLNNGWAVIDDEELVIYGNNID